MSSERGRAVAPTMTAHTLLEIVQLSQGFLETHGSETPRLDAELVAAHALGIRRLDLYLQFDRPLDDTELVAVRELVRRRGTGEPVAYIIGRREFWNRDFAVSSAVLIPRPDTETLIEKALEIAREMSAATVLDVGTGSGCIAVTLAAELPDIRVVATDISAEALEVARENVATHDVGERVDVRHGDWARPLAATEVFDMIVSNPPYILAAEMRDVARDVRDFEPRVALQDRGDGLDSYRHIGELATEHLAPRGCLIVEVDMRRSAAVAGLLGEALDGPATIECDLAGHDRVVVVRRG